FAHVVLFGVLGSFAVAGCALTDRRQRRNLGASRWSTLDAKHKAGPRIHTPAPWARFAIRFIFGLAAFAALILAHSHLIAVRAL
ncbi:MAG TPA: NnrU family protein, partial [Roseovarius sp.]|nr:NnrU family protein [Roseovarius sp.]